MKEVDGTPGLLLLLLDARDSARSGRAEQPTKERTRVARALFAGERTRRRELEHAATQLHFYST